MSQITSPSRRVLGEKDKNASLNILSPPRSGKGPAISSSVKKHRLPSGLFSGRPNLPPPSPRAGQKRGIIEVEGVEAQDRRRVARMSQSTEVVSDSESEKGVNTSMLSNAFSRSTVDTSMTSYPASQEGQNSLEQHFEMPHEEMSQRTLDKIHAVPMPQNHSQPSLLATALMVPPAASQDSVGMSNFIDFGGSDASQRSDGLDMIGMQDPKNNERGTDVEAPPEIQPQQQLTDDERRKLMLEEKAAQLRTRLQLAYFKVQTNQTMRPLSRLKVPASMRRTPSPPTLLSSTITAASAMAALEDMEARVSAFRAQATAQARPIVRSLNSLPIPSIQPTAFSARFAYDATTHAHPSIAEIAGEVIQIPSSPPISRHSADTQIDPDQCSQQATDSEELSLPATKPVMLHPPNDQLSSPPASQDGDENADDGRALHYGEKQAEPVPKLSNIDEELSSEAADGLLQLMRGARPVSQSSNTGGT